MPDDPQHGDAEITGLLATHRGWLRSVIVARLGGTEGADDVLQEVNVAAIEQKSPIRRRASVRAWLFQIAVRQSLLFRRKAGRYRRLIGNAAESARSTDETDHEPLKWLLSSERRRLIRDALDRLEGRDRELLVLKYVEGWTYRQIAEHRGATERSVESRLHRARERLRKTLAQLNIVEDDSKDTGDS